MALPSKEINPPGAQTAPGRSYADAALKRIPTNKHSLMHGETTRPGSPTLNTNASTSIKEIKTRIWRHARSVDGYFLDISKIPNTTDQQHMGVIDKQYKADNFYGLKFLGKTNQRYIEIYPSDEIRDTFVQNGLTYTTGNSQIRLLPCAAIDGKGSVIHVNLTDIPFMAKAKLLQSLPEIMSKYGQVLDFGVKLDQQYGFMLGSGYATIQQLPNEVYSKLSHTIPWNTGNDHCHATFPEMATWCRYCHDEGHTKYECPKAMASIVCYNCDGNGHRQAQCDKPSRKPKQRESKKPRKSYENSLSTEAAKSRWAPGGSKDQAPSVNKQIEVAQSNTPAPITTASPPTSIPAAGEDKKPRRTKKRVASQDGNRRLDTDNASMATSTDEEYQPSSSSDDSSSSESEGEAMEADEHGALMTDQQQVIMESGLTSSNVPSLHQQQPTQYNRDHNNSAPPSVHDLVKAGHPTTQSSYLRHLSLQQYTILSLQETHATETTIPTIQMQLKAQQYLWTYYCGIASFSTDFILTHIATDHLYESERHILCKVHHPHNFYEPFYIINIYAPASSNNKERQEFYQSLYNMLTSLSDTIDLERLIISGDFNYDYSRDIAKVPRIVKTTLEWLCYLEQHFHNCLVYNNMNVLPTYQHGSTTHSTIDYVFAGSGLRHLVNDAAISFPPPAWSDHAVLEVSFKLGKSKLGPGLWRGNPAYANNQDFQQQLETRINTVMASLTDSTSPQDQWELIKRTTKQVIKKFGVKHVNWRKQSIKHLERKRNRLLRSKPPTAILLMSLPRIDTMIHTLQQELVDIAALKAGDSWREQGERSAGYLKRIHQQRTTQQYMATLQEPVTGIIPSADHASSGPEERPGIADSGNGPSEVETTLVDVPGIQHGGATGRAVPATTTASSSSDMETMKRHAWSYYTHLYRADPVSSSTINEYLDGIQFERVLTEDDKLSLMAPITIEELMEQATRSVKATAPGSDGLAYPYLALLFQFDSVKTLVLQVYNDALDGLFPSSWHDLRIRLLPKKGELALLKNWRPICLLVCDSKVFTRLLTKRLARIIGKLINPYQSGFLQNRFICDNGMALSMVLEQAQCFSHTGAGMLLDQEKAYDRVNAVYLGAVLERFGFPDRFVSCINQLFFGNAMFVNINGFFTAGVHQERGIRQGDPLSPLLFDLALEPFLLSILQDPQFCGFNVTDGCVPPPLVNSVAVPTIKCLAYADDVCVLLRDPSDLARLQAHMDRYAAVSNAKFNKDKSEAFALDGRHSPSWQAAFEDMNLQVYHHQGSGSAFRYLGLYFAYNHTQRAQIEEMLLSSVRKQCHIYSQRQLSILGKVTIANSLILSKIWYCLRLLRPTKRFLENVKTCIYQFVWNKKSPLLRKEKVFLPRHSGGLSVLDPSIQQLVLQKRWLNYLVDPGNYPSFLFPLMIHHLSLLPLSTEFPLLAFIAPHVRKSKLCHRDLSIWHSIFELFDHFGYTGLDVLTDLPVPTILALPLLQLLKEVPPEHWLHRHPSFPSNQFLIFDDSQQRLRLRVRHEYTRYPRLCQTLYVDIMQSRTIELQPCVWPHILEAPNSQEVDWSNHEMLGQMRRLTTWSSFSSITFRKDRQAHIKKTQQFPNHTVKLLWSSPMEPKARTVLYRSVSRCIPHKSFLIKFGSVETDICSFCGTGVDTLRHFLIDCPIKWQMWQTILNHYYKDYPISSEILFGTLRFLHMPRFIKDRQRYMSVIATTLWQMWNLYWLHGNQPTHTLSPASIHHFTPRVICLIDRLIPANY
ncbi:hypothetical protein [Parasitella parasitica]|uniref:CCHC-type domain-containing protein n=2 Tax=Parasitella parasitica TaxID=35722 RepID=A0A0B7NHV0_9FUNG|nr:hypothetical protein [Parasitella parasitica]